jgi:hypothetical protein
MAMSHQYIASAGRMPALARAFASRPAPEIRAAEHDRTMRDAARPMDERNAGILPVCRDRGLVGAIATSSSGRPGRAFTRGPE